MADSAAKALSEIGKRLAQTRLNKDSLVKLLRQAAGALSELGQASTLETVLRPLNETLIQDNLLQHKDKDVRLLVAVCFSEIMRVLAPNPPFSDGVLKDIFKLLISMFAELADTTSPYFTRRVKILETISALKCSVLMLDIGCEDLVLEMFQVFFSVVREDHQESLYQGMLSIMTQILDEKVTQPLLDSILRHLLKEAKGVTDSSYKLAVSVLQNSTDKLEPYIRGFLTSSISDRDVFGSKVKEYYHDIIFEISQCAPQMLLSVIPNLTEELLTDQVDVRIKAVQLLGRLFALSRCQIAKENRQLFVEFLRRFADKSVEVRISAAECAKACYMANPTGVEAAEVLTALEGRLLDYDDKVRTQAVHVVCDLAKSNMRRIRPDIILQATERLRDKKVSVRKIAMQKLLELYRAYCTKCLDGPFTHTHHFEQIPCRILALCYDKDCYEFRPQNMDLVLAEDLFPVTVSVEGRIKHWISLFSYFSSPHIKALNTILSLKRRLQMEMQVFLALRKKGKEDGSEEVRQKILTSIKKMSTSFSDPSKAEEGFQKLHQMKDNSIFKALQQLVDESTPFIAAQTIRDTFLKRIGEKHPHYEFFRVLSAKCSYNIFSAEHVECILLESLSRKKAGNLQTSGIDLLLTVVSMFPSFLRGSEEHLLKYFSEEGHQINEKLLLLVSKSGHHISAKLSKIYPFLEWACLEGTRIQSKYSVAAIAALTDSSDQVVFSGLFKKLVDALHAGQNIPTVLQSLGYIAQHSLSTYETREEEITKFVTQKLFSPTDVQSLHGDICFNDDSGCSTSCKLKIYGLKALVRSFLPHQITSLRPQLKELFDILLRLLQEDDISDGIISSENDKAHIRLAAAKAVLQLARRWDLHVSPQMFHLVMMKARDSSSFVRRSLIYKIHKLLKLRVIPIRYACAFALAVSDCFTAVQADSIKFLAEFIKEYGHEAQMHQNFATKDSGETMTNYPEYVVVFLIHFLARDAGFPSESCKDKDVYARFCSSLVIFLHALLSSGFVEPNMNHVSETVSYILSMFRAIKKAEDAVDDRMTPRLHILSDIGVLIVKALYQNDKPSSLSIGMFLLPSSLYKASSARKTEEAKLNFLTKEFIDRNFIETVLHKFELHTAWPTSLHSKRSKKSREVSVKSEDIKKNKNNLELKEQSDPLRRRSKEEQENTCAFENGPPNKQPVSTREIYKGVLAPSASNLEKIPRQCSTLYALERRGSSSHSGPNMGKEQVSSCGSVITKPSLSGSHVSTMEIELEKGIGEDSDGTPMDSVNILKDNIKINFSSKDLGDGSKVLVGHRIRLWSTLDKCFYTGIVDGFDSQNHTHKITYDNGEIEVLRLANENWEVICDSSLDEKGPRRFNVKDCCLEDSVDTSEDRAKHPRKALSQKRKGYTHEELIPSIGGKSSKGRRKDPEPSIPSKKTSSGTLEINGLADTFRRQTRSQSRKVL